MPRKQPAQVAKPPEPEAEVPRAAPAAEPVPARYAAELAPCLGNWPDLEPRDETLPGRSVRGHTGLGRGVSN